jgi:hypothetical protein
MQTLKEIVSSALHQADASIKVASLRDAPIQDRGFSRVDQYLAAELGQLEVEPETTTKQAAAEPSTSVDLDDVRFALKLAEALDASLHVVEKLALEGALNKSTGGKPKAGPTPRGGPAAILPHHFDNAETKTPVPQASAHARAAQANRTTEDGHPKTDEHMQINDGPVIPNGYRAGPVRTNPGHSSKEAALSGKDLVQGAKGMPRVLKDMAGKGYAAAQRHPGTSAAAGGLAGGAIGSRHKKASREQTQRLLNSKIAQHKMLVSLGQTDAANAVLKEAADIAQNADLVFGDNYEAAHFPDNEGIRKLTKAQARDLNQREAGQFWGEPVKRDNAVTTHLAVADGLKLSADSTSPLSKKLIRSEMSTSIAKAPILRGGNEMPHHASATQTSNPQARLLGTSPVMSNVERNEALTKNRSGQRVTKVAAKAKGKADDDDSGGRGAVIGSLLGGPGPGAALGAGISGSKHNRGRRALGAGVGSALGAVGGGLAGAGLGHGIVRSMKGKSSPYAALGTAIGGNLGLTGGSLYGAHKGNKMVHERTKNEKRAGALQAIGQGTLGALRAGARGIGSGAKTVGKSLANAPAIGPRQAPGLLERGANAVRRGAAGARAGLAGVGETGQKIIGGTVLGTAGLGTAGIAHRALGGGDRR